MTLNIAILMWVNPAREFSVIISIQKCHTCRWHFCDDRGAISWADCASVNGLAKATATAFGYDASVALHSCCARVGSWALRYSIQRISTESMFCVGLHSARLKTLTQKRIGQQ